MQGQSCSATPVIAARRRTSPSFLLPSAAGRAGGGAHFRQPRRSSLKKLRALRHDGGDPVLQPLVELLQRTDTLDDESSMDAAAHAAILTGARSLSTPSLVPSDLLGDWAVRWTSTEATSPQSVKTSLPLSLLSFGAVAPQARVHLLHSYNCVTTYGYSLFHAVVPAEHGCVQAGHLTMDHALLLELRGSWLQTRPSAPRNGNNAVPTQAHPDRVTADNGLNRILVRFDTARVHIVPRPAPPAHGEAGVGPSTTQRGTPAEDERCGWLARHGLQEHHPVGLKGKPTSFIDIQYLDDELRVHTGESGTVYVLQRLRDDGAFHLPCAHRDQHGRTV